MNLFGYNTRDIKARSREEGKRGKERNRWLPLILLCQELGIHEAAILNQEVLRRKEGKKCATRYGER